MYGNEYDLLKSTKEQEKKEYIKGYYLKNKKEITEKMSQRYFAQKKAINKNKTQAEESSLSKET